MVVTLLPDQKAVALGPQLAVFAASLRIPTTLVIGPQQDSTSLAALRTAGAANPEGQAWRLRYLRVLVPGLDGRIPRSWIMVSPSASWSSMRQNPSCLPRYDLR